MLPPQSTGLFGSLPVVESEPELPAVGSVLEPPLAVPSVVSLPLSATVDAPLDAVVLDAVVLDALVEPTVMPPELPPDSPDSSTPERGHPAKAASTHTETTGTTAARVMDIATMDRADGRVSSAWMKKNGSKWAVRPRPPRGRWVWNATQACGLLRR